MRWIVITDLCQGNEKGACAPMLNLNFEDRVVTLGDADHVSGTDSARECYYEVL